LLTLTYRGGNNTLTYFFDTTFIEICSISVHFDYHVSNFDISILKDIYLQEER